MHYEIRNRGLQNETILSAFPGLAAQAQDSETMLRRAQPDQAVLYGVLAQPEAERLGLFEVHCDRSSETAHHARPSRRRA